MLWNDIFNFFTRYIFGGYDSVGNLYNGAFGYVINSQGDGENLTIGDVCLSFKGYSDTGSGLFDYMNFGNYLSLIATIITIVAILLFCIFIY